jgi:hypothetical protein
MLFHVHLEERVSTLKMGKEVLWRKQKDQDVKVVEGGN